MNQADVFLATLALAQLRVNIPSFDLTMQLPNCWNPDEPLQFDMDMNMGDDSSYYCRRIVFEIQMLKVIARSAEALLPKHHISYRQH